MKRLAILCTVISLMLLLSSCNRNQVYKEYHKFQNNSWKRIHEDIRFSVKIDDIKSKYDVKMPVRHAPFYPYQYIEVGFNIYSPSGQGSFSTRKFFLQTPDGKWKGQGMGDIYDIEFPIFDHYSFNEKGIYIFEIQNLTGNNYVLPGIMEIGLDITHSK
jgi:gliding motility-associated lipoprotein GldH